MSKAVDDILGFLRTEQLSMEDQAELIARLRDGEADNHRPAGAWAATLGPTGSRLDAEIAGFNVSWVHGPDVDPDDGLAVTFYHGQMDGKPVIQIDGEADFRINVNDCPVWDQSTSVDYSMPEELRDALKERKGKVWVGTISDTYGVWTYVGATEDALYRDMRSNYAEIEYRDESDHDWMKRADDAGAIVNVGEYHVEEGL